MWNQIRFQMFEVFICFFYFYIQYRKACLRFFRTVIWSYIEIWNWPVGVYCIRYTVYGILYTGLSLMSTCPVVYLWEFIRVHRIGECLQSWTDDSKSRLHWKCWLNDLLEVIELTFWFEKAFKMIKIVSKGERSSSLLTSLINFWEFN